MSLSPSVFFFQRLALSAFLFVLHNLTVSSPLNLTHLDKKFAALTCARGVVLVQKNLQCSRESSARSYTLWKCQNVSTGQQVRQAVWRHNVDASQNLYVPWWEKENWSWRHYINFIRGKTDKILIFWIKNRNDLFYDFSSPHFPGHNEIPTALECTIASGKCQICIQSSLQQNP